MNLENRIQQYNSLLTENDHKIITYLLAHKDDIIHKTITALSNDIGVSPASITRFCKRLQFHSFQEMKYSIIKNTTEKTKADGTFEVIYKYYDMILKSTQQFIKEDKTTNIITSLKSANRVLFCGIGNSGIIAEEFNGRMERMGIHSSVSTESHEMLIGSTLLDHHDVLFCISNSGQTKSIIDSARLAKENNATVIVVTNYENTALTNIADEVILISSYKYIQDNKFMNTQIPGLFLLDIMTYKLLNDKELLANWNKTLQTLNQLG